jgi:TonB-dependent SusC/RagA subfamily outer membrane receptor
MDYGLCVAKTGKLKQLMSFPFFFVAIGLSVCAYAQTSGLENKPAIKDTLKISTDPLYVLDGKIIPKDSLQSIDLNKIESIEVLKDSSRTAIYGPGGRNGVILIHTNKSGFKRDKDQN